MRHSFLLDENILYHGIRGVERHDQPDDTARLIQTILRVCHSLVIHHDVRARYLKILNKFKQEPSCYHPVQLGFQATLAPARAR